MDRILNQADLTWERILNGVS